MKLWPPIGTATLELPCGRCLGCKSDRALEWARRAVHEAKSWPHNSFVTLTYAPEHIPSNGELVPEHLQGFLRRLRRHYDRSHPVLLRDPDWGVRYLASGEYGDNFGRPHYHLCLFNFDVSDRKDVGKGLADSRFVEAVWGLGQVRLAEFTGATANYVAQYTMKKVGREHCDADGVVKTAPFVRMSRKPALGTRWLAKYQRDLQRGYLVTDGKPGRVPRAYKKKLDGDLLERVQEGARAFPRERHDLRAAEIIHKRRVELANNRTL